MRNGFLGSLVWLILAAVQAHGQSPATLGPPVAIVEPPDIPWQPPRTDLDDRPNIGPSGYRFYGAVDYILWWTEKDRPVPTLTGGTGNVLLPGTVDFGALVRNGERATLGTWLDQQQTVGLEIGGFWVGDRSPGEKYQEGDVGVHPQLHSQMSGVDAALRTEIYRGTWAHLDLLTGVRYLDYDEDLNIAQRDFTTEAVTSDRFGTHNRFYGGDLGAEMEMHYQKGFVDLWGKAALGVNDEALDVNGTTFNNGQLLPGGLLVSPLMAGRYHRDQFAVVPEFGADVGYHLTQHLRVTAGYTFFYLSNAVRPGEQIDALYGTPKAADFTVHSSDLWVQGLNLGLEFRF